MSRTRYRFGDDCQPHFMTSTVVAWLPVFSHPCFADVILDSWRFLQREREIRILAFVIMENHIHWIAVGPQLGKRVKEFKSFTATSILKELQRKQYRTLLQELEYFKLRHRTDQQHQLWQEGSHPQVIETTDMLWQKIEYTHNNPLRRGYVDDPLHWRYSSARAYARQDCLIDVCTNWQ
jgi:REP element-mobilizing transposase RayT